MKSFCIFLFLKHRYAFYVYSIWKPNNKLKKLPLSIIKPKGSLRHNTCLEKPNGEEGLPELPRPPPVDPRLPLSTKQKFQIMTSWKGIDRAIEPTGIEMFLRLFKQNSSLLALFAKFQSLNTTEKQMKSLELKEHATIVMRTISAAINSFDNIDLFFDFLYHVGQTHRKIPSFRKELFWQMKKPFLDAIKETLGDRYTENMDQIYKVAIKFVLETLVKGYSLLSSPTSDIPPEYFIQVRNSVLSARNSLPSKLQELQIKDSRDRN